MFLHAFTLKYGIKKFSGGNIMFCPYCGKELDNGSRFCIHCGERLEEDTPESSVEAAKETVEKAVEAVNETMDNAAEAVKETAEDASEAAAETAEKAAEAASEAVKDVTEKAAETAQTVAGNVAETEEKAPETAEEVAESVVETAADALKETPEEIPVEKDGASKAIDVAELIKNKKVLIITAAAIVFVVLVVLIAVFGGATGNSGSSAIKGVYYVCDDSGEGSVIYNGKKIKGTDLSSSADIAVESNDGTKAVIRDGDKALYYLSNGNISKITEDFEIAMINISADGSTVVYVYDDAIYTYKGGKVTKAADIEDGLAAPAVISPNGDTIAYAETNGEKISAYAVKGGKHIDLDEKVIPFSVSNGGGIIYGLDKNLKLSYIKNLKADSAESVKTMSLNFTPVLSSDNKQVLFASDNGIYYFDSSLKEEIKVTGSSIEPIYPEGGIRCYDNLKEFIAYSDGKVVKFTRKGDDFDKETLASSAKSCLLSADGKKLVYAQGDELYRISVSNPDSKDQLGSEILDYDADKNLKNVYFLNRDNVLRYADGKSKNGKKIIDDVGDFVVNPDGVCVFTDDDDTLYYSAGGSDKKKAGLEDVKGYVEITHNMVYVESDGDLYISTDGKKFTKP